MQIILTQDEIMEALEGYVTSQIALAPNQSVSIDLKASKGDVTATLDIRNGKQAKAKPATRSKAKDPEPEPEVNEPEVKTVGRAISDTPDEREPDSEATVKVDIPFDSAEEAAAKLAEARGADKAEVTEAAAPAEEKPAARTSIFQFAQKA